MLSNPSGVAEACLPFQGHQRENLHRNVAEWSHLQPIWICPADAFLHVFILFHFIAIARMRENAESVACKIFTASSGGSTSAHLPVHKKIKLTRARALITFTPSANALAHHRSCTLRRFFRCWRQCIRYCWLLSISQSVPDAVSSTSESSFFTSVSAGATNERFQSSRSIL